MNKEKISIDVNKITDALGKPIDPGIKPLVREFIRLGIKTEGSCEGHKAHGAPYPWIDFPFGELKKVINILMHYGAYLHHLKDDVEYIFIPYGGWLRLRPHINNLGKAQKEVRRFANFLKKYGDEIPQKPK